MRLKSLHLHGFKSFADTTDFDFHQGVTAVVGPNGCGKSNVVDAIRWVLGETSAKALRGGEMADVIFNGTDKRSPVGMAEVTMTLADCETELGIDFNEVSITRRVFREGKSEYRINNQLCRLKDINELLMGSGLGQVSYSIMEQGKIDLLLSSKPEDRRAVFEEAAGITRFKAQKKEAIRKLDYTEANLIRVTDIIAEVVRQKNTLQRQAAKARRYQTLLKDVKTLDTHYSHRRYLEYQAEKSELETSVGSLRARQQELQDSIADAEQNISEARTRFQELEGRIASKKHEHSELLNQVRSSEGRIGFNQERSNELEALIAQNEGDITSTRDRLADQKTEIESAEQSLSHIVEGIEKQEAKVEEQNQKAEKALQSRTELNAVLNKLRGLASQAENTIVTVRAQLNSNQSQIESDAQRKAQLAEQLAKMESERNTRIAERDSLTKELATTSETRAAQQRQVADLGREARSAEIERRETTAKLDAVRQELGEKSARLKALNQLLAKGEGLQKGTQAVLQGLGDPEKYGSRITGVLTSFLEVGEKFIPSIEAALGAHLQTVLVDDTDLAEQIIDTLAKDELGEATLLPADLSSAPSDSQMMTLPEGSIAWALDRVTVRNDFKPLVDKLLERVLIVGDLPTALGLKRSLPDLTFVTLKGELVTPEGTIRGGASSDSAAGSLLHRQNEVRQLETSTSELASEVATLQERVVTLRDHTKERQDALDNALSLLQELTVQESTLKGQFQVVEREVTQMGSKLEGVQWEQGELFKRLESAETLIESLIARENEAKKDLEKRQSDIRTREGELAEATRHEAEVNTLLNELRTSLAVERRAAQALQQQKEPMANRLKELEDLIARRDADIASYREKIEAAAADSESLRANIGSAKEGMESLTTTLTSLEAERKEQDEALSKTEQALLANRRELNGIGEQRGNEEIKATQIDLRIENLADTVRERYNIELESFEIDTHALLVAIDIQKKNQSSLEKRRANRAARENAENAGSSSDGDGVAEPEAVEEEPVAGGSQTDASDAEIEIPEDGPDWAFVESVVGELKRKLDSMGPVNLDAIEEFEELEERHNFLQNQHDDLVNSKEELLSIIEQINRETRKLFAETFYKVRENFQNTFKELFGKGATADLVLVDENDPLESGIDIIARPPGKKPTSITLLSGGERSMTAVALLFSIYMVKPSPFCVLDELDAPLDESNIGRFLKMLDRFIDQSQFVIVTHNKRTMNRADILYGVTQQEFGVSKLVGMQLTQNKHEPTPLKKKRAKARAKA